MLNRDWSFMAMVYLCAMASVLPYACVAGNRVDPASANDDSQRRAEAKQTAGGDATSHQDQSAGKTQYDSGGGPMEIKQGWTTRDIVLMSVALGGYWPNRVLRRGAWWVSHRKRKVPDIPEIPGQPARNISV